METFNSTYFSHVLSKKLCGAIGLSSHAIVASGLPGSDLGWAGAAAAGTFVPSAAGLLDLAAPFACVKQTKGNV